MAPLSLPVGDEREAKDIDTCATQLGQHLGLIRKYAADAARVLRHVINERSSSHAALAAATILEDNWGADLAKREFLLKLMDFRHGVPISRMLWAGVRKTPATGQSTADHVETRRSYLRHLGTVYGRAAETTAQSGAEWLSRQVADGRSLIITVGHSRMVAQTLRELAAKRKADVDKVDFFVWVVRPRARGGEHRELVEEQALMKAELLRSPLLESRVSRTGVEQLRDSKLDLPRRGLIVLGAEGVSLDGRVFHPRGRLDVHVELSNLLDAAKSPGAKRVVVAAPHKIILDTDDVEWRSHRLLTCFEPGIDRDYDQIVSYNDHAAAGFASTLLLAQRSTWWDDVAKDLKIPRADRLWDVEQRVPRQAVASGAVALDPASERPGPGHQEGGDVATKPTGDS
jgi:hypothetical protein